MATTLSPALLTVVPTAPISGASGTAARNAGDSIVVISACPAARMALAPPRGAANEQNVGATSQPFSVSSSSTAIVERVRNSTTRIARPIADSAAATVRMKNTNTWPAMSPR